MSFLQSLRMANIFPKNRANDQPFGMPEIDDGNVGTMFRQVTPLAQSLDNQAMMRQKELMDHRNMITNQNKPQLSMQDKAWGLTAPRNFATKPAPPVQGGFSPMQKMFQQRDAQEREQAIAQSEMSQKFNQAMELQKMKGSQDIDLENVRTAGDSDQIAQRGGIDRDLAGMRQRHESEMANARTQAEMVALQKRHEFETSQINTRETARGREDRLTQREKPVTGTAATAKDANDALVGKVQRLKLSNPDLAKRVIEDPKSPGMYIISGATAQEKAAIDKYFADAPAPGAAADSGAGKVITQKNSKGQTRTSTDGGKTWTMK